MGEGRRGSWPIVAVIELPICSKFFGRAARVEKEQPEPKSPGGAGGTGRDGGGTEPNPAGSGCGAGPVGTPAGDRDPAGR